LVEHGIADDIALFEEHGFVVFDEGDASDWVVVFAHKLIYFFL
jgi:hypothetical protein